MDANSGEPWSEADIRDLTLEIDHGRTVAEAASFLCRDYDEVREKMKELGLVQHPGKRGSLRVVGDVKKPRTEAGLTKRD